MIASVLTGGYILLVRTSGRTPSSAVVRQAYGKGVTFSWWWSTGRCRSERRKAGAMGARGESWYACGVDGIAGTNATSIRVIEEDGGVAEVPIQCVFGAVVAGLDASRAALIQVLTADGGYYMRRGSTATSRRGDSRTEVLSLLRCVTRTEGRTRTMRRLVVVVVAVAGTLLVTGGAAGAEDETSASSTIYVVQRGDWLWKIARQQLRQAGSEPTASEVRTRAEAIYEDNRDVIGTNRHRLRPGQRLRLRPMAVLVPQQPCTAPPGSGCA